MHAWVPGIVGDALGDVLYAALIALIALFVAPRTLVFGSAFTPTDLIFCAVGVAIAIALGRTRRT